MVRMLCIFADVVGDLIDPISFMKKQLGGLLDDLPEEELNLAKHNPYAKVQSFIIRTKLFAPAVYNAWILALILCYN